MNSRTARRQPPRKESLYYLRYLKPGALAQLRDSRISGHRSRRPVDCEYAQISSPPRSFQIDGPPSPRRICSPRFPQRKKLMAAKGFYCSAAEPDLQIGAGESAVILAQ